MLDSIIDIFRLSNKLRFSIPLYKLFGTQTWRKLIKCEDFFFRYALKTSMSFMLAYILAYRLCLVPSSSESRRNVENGSVFALNLY